jgi:O-antigen/teichoic acid export membrane protein
LIERLRQRAIRGLPPTFLTNVGWQYVSVVTVSGCGFLYTFVVGRALGVAEFGLMSLGISFSSLLFGLFQIRLHEAVIRFVTGHLEHGRPRHAVATVYASLVVDVVACCCAVAAILVLAPLAQAHLIRDARGPAVLALSAATVFVTNVGNATAIGVLRACDRFMWHSAASAGGALLRLVATALALRVAGGGVFTVLWVGAAAALACNAAIVAAAVVALTRRVGGDSLRAPLRLVAPEARSMAVFAGTNYLLSLSGAVLRDLDVTALGWFTSLDVVGTYRVAKSFAALLSQVSDPVLFALLPEMSRYWVRDEHGPLKGFVLRITAFGLAAGVVMYAGSVVVVPPLIVKVMGAQFQPAGPLFLGMAWWVVVGMPLMWAHSLACAAGRPDLSLRAVVAGNALAFVLYLVLIPSYGGMGAAVAYAAGLTTASLIAGALAWRSCLAGKLRDQG